MSPNTGNDSLLINNLDNATKRALRAVLDTVNIIIFFLSR